MVSELTGMVDSHVHYLNPTAFRVDWARSEPALMGSWLPRDYAREADGLSVQAAVFVEANVPPVQAIDEARWAGTLARVATPIRAIVAYAPVDDPRSLERHLDGLAGIAPAVRGVRRNIQDESDARGVCLAPGFLESMSLLAGRRLSFDVCVTHQQLAAIIELVERCPDTAFVLDHMAKPAIAQGALDPWRSELRALAAFPNVVCKISGLVTEADRHTWTQKDLRPYVDHAAEVFGEDRLLYGSDWPVVRLAGGHRRWAAALQDIVASWPASAQLKLWSDNARRVYRLDA